MPEFKIGDKVVCVDNSGTYFKGEDHLDKDKIYIVNLVSGNHIALENHEKCHGAGCTNNKCCGTWLSSRFKLYTESNDHQPQKRKCECPIDVLMNQGCQCGGH